jgi:hypothetical protein
MEEHGRVMADVINIDDLFGMVDGRDDGPPRKKGHRRGPPGSLHDRSRLERAKRDAIIAAMYAAEETLVDIADAVGLNGKTGRVSQIVQGMIAKWRRLGLKSVSERQAEHLAGLDALEQELFAAWRDSREGRLVNVSERVQHEVKKFGRRDAGKEYSIEKNVGRPTVAKRKVYKRLESSSGDPRYMALILDIRKERAKIWGLYAKDLSGGGPGTGGYDPESLATLDKSQLLARFMALVENVKMEHARKLAGGVIVDITPRAMLTDGEHVPARRDDEF